MTRTIGVLGGMGPAATADFLRRLVEATPAASDQDHPRILIDCNPKVPNRNRAIAGEGPSPAPVLAEMARGLERQGADFLVMPCNAAHAFASAIRDAVAIPFLSMVDETARVLAGAGPVGLLAADATLAAGLYQARLPRTIEPTVEDQAGFMALLGRIKQGDMRNDVRSRMAELGRRLAARGAELVLAACTEVPLVLASDALPVRFVDATGILIDAAIRRAVAA